MNPNYEGIFLCSKYIVRHKYHAIFLNNTFLPCDNFCSQADDHVLEIIVEHLLADVHINNGKQLSVYQILSTL